MTGTEVRKERAMGVRLRLLILIHPRTKRNKGAKDNLTRRLLCQDVAAILRSGLLLDLELVLSFFPSIWRTESVWLDYIPNTADLVGEVPTHFGLFS